MITQALGVRRRFFVAALVASSLLCGCGGEQALRPVAERMAKWKQAGDTAWNERAFDHVVRAYRKLYALVDPVPGQSKLRAVLSFRIGHSLGRMAETAPTRGTMFARVRDARIWFRQTEALRPQMHHVWLERAKLLEVTRATGDSPKPLIEAYAKYLKGFQAAKQPDPSNEEEWKRWKLALMRMNELSSEKPADGR